MPTTVTLMTSQPGLKMTTESWTEPPTKTGPKSSKDVESSRSGTPVTVIVAGTPTSGLTGSLLEMAMDE